MKNLFSIWSYKNFMKYWISRLLPVMESILDGIRKMPMIKKKIFLCIMKAYMMVCIIITKFHDSSFSQSEVKGAVLPTSKNEVRKSHPSISNIFADTQIQRMHFTLSSMTFVWVPTNATKLEYEAKNCWKKLKNILILSMVNVSSIFETFLIVAS